jgi:hypothetical protein
LNKFFKHGKNKFKHSSTRCNYYGRNRRGRASAAFCGQSIVKLRKTLKISGFCFEKGIKYLTLWHLAQKTGKTKEELDGIMDFFVKLLLRVRQNCTLKE